MIARLSSLLVALASFPALGAEPSAQPAAVPDAGAPPPAAAPAPAPILPRWVAALAEVPPDPPPKEITNNFHFLVSNEQRHHLFREAIADRGGIFIGLGTDQNYLMAGWAKPEVLVLLDFDQAIVDMHGLYRVAFLTAKGPAEFRELWLPRNAKRMRTAITELCLEKRQRTLMLAAFETGRPWVETRIKHLMEIYPKLKVPTFLDDDAQFQYIAGLFKSGQVLAVRGDLTARKTMAAIGALAHSMQMPVRVLYLSNAERYFPYNQGFKDNILAMLFDERSLVLRTVGLGSDKDLDPYYYVTQKGLDFQEWVKAPRMTGVGVLHSHLKKLDRPYLYTIEDLPRPAGKPPEKGGASAPKAPPAAAPKRGPS